MRLIKSRFEFNPETFDPAMVVSFDDIDLVYIDLFIFDGDTSEMLKEFKSIFWSQVDDQLRSKSIIATTLEEKTYAILTGILD